MRHVVLILIFLYSMIAGTVNLAQQPARRALLIGVAKYDKAGFTNLEYPEADVKSLEEVLTAAGFQVTLMLGSLPATDPLRATRANIAHQLLTPDEFAAANDQKGNKLKPGFVAELGSLNKDDVVLVAIAGHGRQKSLVAADKKQEIPYYCPADASNAEESSWVSINQLMENISLCSGSQNNLILVDACRDNPSRGRGIDGAEVTLPGDNLAICFSSSAGTEAYEAKELGHGIFTHFVIQGLKGEAANRRNQVTWDTLVSYVRTSVAEQAPILVQREQQPNAIGNVKGVSPVLIAAVAGPLLVVPLATDKGMEHAEVANDAESPGALITNTIGMRLNLIQPGKFMMGSAKGDGDERPVHEVEITRPFYMAIHEVTQEQWNAVMKDKQNPWKDMTQTIQGDDVAASYVSWEDAQEFVSALNKMEQGTGRKYGLPTEAEWEYCCRAGTTSEYSFGDDESGLSQYAWWGATFGEGNAINERYAHQVVLKKPNRWGLYDMHGNVFEWCEDWHGYDYYGKSPTRDPRGPESGSSRVLRGGSWTDIATYCRSANRFNRVPSFRLDISGFRVLCRLD